MARGRFQFIWWHEHWWRLYPQLFRTPKVNVYDWMLCFGPIEIRKWKVRMTETTLEAGPQLDDRVAELMGWAKCESECDGISLGCYWVRAPTPAVAVDEWNPSTDISDAMEVVEWSRDRGLDWGLCTTNRGWLAEVHDRGELLCFEVFGETIPLAICRAFVKAMESTE